MITKLRLSLANILLATMILGCGGGGGGGSAAAPATAPPEADSVTISGTISFDKVRQTSADNGGLDYTTVERLPAIGIVVEALNSANTILSTTTTDNNGNYSVAVGRNANVRIRAKAQLLDTNWHVKVTDNTSNDALYVLDGQLRNTGTADSRRDLHASAGWGGAGYTSTRAAAPFAMLAVVRRAIEQIIAIDATVVFPAAEIRWSINNRPNNGRLTDGDIGTSFFTITNGLPTLYILGAENVDTDEFDEDVIAHEWGHYLESQLARNDNVGGEHSLSNLLDMRVAYSEGLGNALAGVVNGDPFYVDSSGPNQADSFTLNLETKNPLSPTGWFSEDSIQTILFDITDPNNEGQDTLSLGMAGLFSVIADTSFKQSAALSSIFSFAESFKTVHTGSSVGLDNLLQAHNINSSSAFAEGETNSGFRANTLPVYTDISVGGSTITLCSSNIDGEANKLGNFRFVRVDIPVARSYTISLTRASGPALTDPDFFIIKQGVTVFSSESGVDNIETGTSTLTPGLHTLALTDFFNVDLNPNSGGTSCFDLSII